MDFPMKTHLNKPNTFIVLIMLIGIVSANGLQINPSTLNINTTQGKTYNINLTIKNEETYPLENINFENIPFISFPLIPSLKSGESVIATAKIEGNSNFNGQIRLKGFFNSSL